MLGEIEYRPVARTAYCRGCDKEILPKTEKVAAMYSWRDRGQHIYICSECVGEMYRLVIQDIITSKELGEKV